jgi:AcrR family transcriptional regulator
MYESQAIAITGGGELDRDRDRPGRERRGGPGEAAWGDRGRRTRDAGPAGPEPPGRPGRGLRPPGPRRGEGAESLDELWPPFTQPSLDREHRAHRRLREHAEPGQQGRGRTRLAPSLSRAEIVDAAIAVADAEGADAVSMRKIAQVLRAGTMSLYWHVANKEHLLDLMLDALLAEVEVPEPSGDWRADMQTLARTNRAMLLRHLWVMDFVGGRPPLGPNTLLYLERSLAMLDRTGLDQTAAFRVLETVQTYVMGAALRESREMRVRRDEEESGVTEEVWQPAMKEWRDRLDADGRFMHFVAFLDVGIDPDDPETRDERFEFGLDCVLDGIAAKVAEISRRSPA